ncbi:type II toxin-antitoxin system PemK/MazF family toxin [Pilimelia columellifera]|uniref:mRNA interferase MazF n=1 Tax=Pilimelia columellifera subsp. columellifera TaxID=706583 RepID=A0ABP6AY56_9ACTN
MPSPEDDAPAETHWPDSAPRRPDYGLTADIRSSPAARMKRGEIWTVGDRSDLRYRVLVLTGDSFNDRDNVAPLCAPIVRLRGSDDLPAYAVALAEQDPITGVVVLNRLRRVPASAGAERIGMVTGASLARLTDALRELFEL